MCSSTEHGWLMGKFCDGANDTARADTAMST